MERNDYKSLKTLVHAWAYANSCETSGLLHDAAQSQRKEIFNEGQIRKSQYLFEKGIILLKAFLTKKGFYRFLDSCEWDATNPESNLKFLLGYQEEES